MILKGRDGEENACRLRGREKHCGQWVGDWRGIYREGQSRHEVWRVGQGGRKGARLSTWPTATSVTLSLRRVKIYLISWSSQGYVIMCEL